MIGTLFGKGGVHIVIVCQLSASQTYSKTDLPQSCLVDGLIFTNNFSSSSIFSCIEFYILLKTQLQL